MKSVFDGAIIDGADFTDANLDLSQRKSLCERATGTNSQTGVNTIDSLECTGLKGYMPPKPKADLHNTEYVKYDLSNQDLGEANLQGAYMSVTTAKNSSFKGANMTDLIAYATRFDNADFTDANLTNGELMKSVFDGAIIDGADFTDANLDLSQRKSLCERASGTNSQTGVNTIDSLECTGLKGYMPPKPKA